VGDVRFFNDLSYADKIGTLLGDCRAVADKRHRAFTYDRGRVIRQWLGWLEEVGEVMFLDSWGMVYITCSPDTDGAFAFGPRLASVETGLHYRYDMGLEPSDLEEVNDWCYVV
jgi:hypothetical protein